MMCAVQKDYHVPKYQHFCSHLSIVKKRPGQPSRPPGMIALVCLDLVNMLVLLLQEGVWGIAIGLDKEMEILL